MTDQQLAMIHDKLGDLSETVASLSDVLENSNISRLVTNVAKLNEAVGDLNDTVREYIKHSIETINDQGKRIAKLEAGSGAAE